MIILFWIVTWLGRVSRTAEHNAVINLHFCPRSVGQPMRLSLKQKIGGAKPVRDANRKTSDSGQGVFAGAS